MALQYLIATALSLWLLFIFFGNGSIVFRVLRIHTFDTITNIFLKTGIGFGIAGNCVMVLSFLQLAKPMVILTILIALSITAAPSFVYEFRISLNHREKVKLFVKKVFSLPGITLIALSALYFARSLLPPTGFDALMYHLSTADLVLKHGGFYNIFFNPQSDFPMLTEMNYMIGLALGNDIVCNQLALVTYLFSIGAIYIVCKFVRLRNSAILLSMLLFATATSTIAEVPECNVDYALASWVVFSLFVFGNGLKKGDTNQIVIGSIFAGMAMQTKIFGCFMVPLLVTLFFICRKKPNVQTSFYLLLTVIIMVMPWYIKSFVHHGSVLPVSQSMIAGQGLGNPMGLTTDNPIIYHFVNVILRVCAAPWSFSLMPTQHQGDTFGPLLIALLPFMFILKPVKQAKVVFAMIIVYLALVLMMEMIFIKGGSSIRYSIFILITGIPLSMVLLEQVKTVYPRIGIVFTYLIAIQITLGCILLIKRYHIDWVALLSNKTRDEYLSKVLPEYALVKYMNNSCIDGAICTSYDYSTYYIQKPYYSLFRHYINGQEMSEDLKRLGVKYLFANDKLDTTANRNAFPEIKEKVLIKSENGFYLFRLTF